MLLFSSQEVFTFLGYFSLPPALHSSFSGLWRLPPALSSTLAIFGCFTFARLFHHIFTTSGKVLSGHFLPTGVFDVALLPHIFDTFCDSDDGRNTPSRILICACPHRVVPSGWRTDLNYSYCSYKTIDLSIAQWATKYRVKIKLLNMFCLLKVIGKDYKNTLNKTW